MYYKQIFIKSESDLPKEDKVVFCHSKESELIIAYQFNGRWKEVRTEDWINDIDWYLQPIEQPEITDADIEAWVLNECKDDPDLHKQRFAIMYGAKAMRDGEIKRNQ